MYFYRIMNKEELKNKEIKSNIEDFYDAINTHRYLKGVNYIHLFLNAESCFEDFILEEPSNLIIVKFDIPDEIVFKYGIGLGGYQLYYNKCTKKHREMVIKNAAGTSNFWVPEIAIPEFDFNYDWCTDVYKPKRIMYQYALPENFMTDDLLYKQIVDDGYLKGYKNEAELLKKYKAMLQYKKKIIEILKNNKNINISSKDLNNDSLYACLVLTNYALAKNIVESKSDIKITVNNEPNINSINITDGLDQDNFIIIDKNHNHTFPGFSATLDKFGFDVDKNILKNINNDEKRIIEHSLTKK